MKKQQKMQQILAEAINQRDGKLFITNAPKPFMNKQNVRNFCKKYYIHKISIFEDIGGMKCHIQIHKSFFNIIGMCFYKKFKNELLKNAPVQILITVGMDRKDFSPPRCSCSVINNMKNLPQKA
jgi:hypothetical protein